MSVSEQILFQPGTSLRIQWAAIAFLGCTLVVSYMEYRYAFGVGLAMGLTAFLIKGPYYTLSQKTLVVSSGFRRLVLPLEGSEFHVSKITGFTSWCRCLKGDGHLLRVRVPGGREYRFALVLTREDGDELLDLLRERAHVVEV